MAYLSRCAQSAAFALTFGLIAACAQTLDQAAAQLASRMGAGLPAGSTLSLTVESFSPLPAPLVTRVREAIRSAIVNSGLRLDTNSPTASQVTISENARGFLLIARTPAAGGTRTAMVPWTIRPSEPSQVRASISRTLILEHSSPVLDISLTNNGTELWVLEPDQLVHFRNEGGAWRADRNTSLPLARPPARDARGRLTPDPRLPDTSSAWPLDARHTVRWAAGRNYFLDDSGGFFSAASMEGLELKSGLDGRTRVTSSAGQLLAKIDDWGSDLAAMQGSCGEPFLLAGPKTDGGEFDRLQAYRFADGQPIPSGEPLAFYGVLTALWPAESPAQVTAVVHNRKTQQYEVYRVAISCGN
ncbi:MAG: hypothetical protein ABJF23_03815 [Bryobacteraceae bacterium]